MRSRSSILLFIGLLLLFLLMAPVIAGNPPAIQWQEVLGSSADDFPSSINQTPDGGYIVAGSSRSYSGGGYSGENQDILVMKLDASGNLQWQKTFGDYSDDGGSAVQPTSDGGYILVGYTNTSSRNRDVWVLKLDSAGNLLWQKVLGGYGEDSGSDIQQTNDGGYIIIGYTLSANSGDVGPNHGGRDVWVIKLNPAGTMQWQRLYGGSADDTGYSIRQTTDRGYILAGSTMSSNSGDVGSSHGPDDAWVVKLDSSGNIQWQKVLGGNAHETGYGIRQTSDGGYILIGVTGSSNTGDVGPSHGMVDYWVLKLDSAGSIRWQKVLGGNDVDNGRAVEQTMDGGYILTGYSVSSNSGDVGQSHSSCDAWVVRLDPSGNILWQRQYGGSGVEWGLDIRQTKDGGYVFTGHTDSSNSGDVGMNHGRNDFWVVKLAPDTPSLFPTPPPTTTRIPSVGQASASYQVGFDGLRYNADGSNMLELDLAKARRSLATVSVYTDRVEIYQRSPDGVLLTFRGSTFAVRGDQVSGPVTAADLITDPVEAPLTPGTVAGSVRAVLPELSRQGLLKATISDTPDPSIVNQFSSLLAQNGLTPGEVAYTYDIRKSSMPQSANASVNLSLPEPWVTDHGGIRGVRVIRVSDTTGTAELLPVTYTGTDERGMMYFEAVSLNGTSVFGLVTLKATKIAQENDPSLALIPMQQPAVTTLIGMLGWLAGSVLQNPAGAIAVVACAGAAYAGRKRGMW